MAVTAPVMTAPEVTAPVMTAPAVTAPIPESGILRGGFNNLLRKHHPNIWALLNEIREEQSVTEVIVQQLTAGRVVKRKKKATTECQKRIDKLRSDYNNGVINVIDLITGVSHNLAGN